MGADFYEDDYSGGGYYDGAGDDFVYSYGAGESGLPPDYAPGYEPGGAMDLGSGSSDLFNTYLDYYIDLGYSPLDAVDLAAQDAGGFAFEETTSERYAPPITPDLSFPEFGLPFIPWDITPYTPYFPELPTPQAPSDPRLPGYCPAGTYHPIDDPYSCVPFPTQTQQQQQRPAQQQPASGSGSGSGSQSSKPQQQQQQQACPTGYCKHPTTGQCIPIPQGYYRDPATAQCRPLAQQQQQACPTGYYRATNGQCLPIPRCAPGTVFDQATGRCVLPGQAVSPLPIGAEDLLSNLKDLPWWVWLALGGLLLLGKDDDGRKTTVTYRRAS